MEDNSSFIDHNNKVILRKKSIHTEVVCNNTRISQTQEGIWYIVISQQTDSNVRNRIYNNIQF